MNISEKGKRLLIHLIEDSLIGIRFEARSCRRMLSIQSEEAPTRSGWIEKAREAQEAENELESILKELKR